MKKATLFLGALSIMALVSCKKEEKQVDVTTTPATDTTVVVHETVQAPAPAKDTVVVKPEESDGTSVSIGSNGVNVNSKDGTKKTTVNVSKDNAGVEIKK